MKAMKTQEKAEKDMTEFSGKLESYIRKRGFTNFYFAKICGVDRTLMQKYISGQRIPKSEQMLRVICEKLQMSPAAFSG